MSGETLTINEEKLKKTAAKVVGDAATDAAKGAIKPVLDMVDRAKESGIGGTWIENTWKWLSDLFTSIGDWISSAANTFIDWIASFFTGSSTPAATPAATAASTAAPASGAGRAATPNPEVAPPANTPPVTRPVNTAGRNAGRE